MFLMSKPILNAYKIICYYLFQSRYKKDGKFGKNQESQLAKLLYKDFVYKNKVFSDVDRSFLEFLIHYVPSSMFDDREMITFFKDAIDNDVPGLLDWLEKMLLPLSQKQQEEITQYIKEKEGINENGSGESIKVISQKVIKKYFLKSRFENQFSPKKIDLFCKSFRDDIKEEINRRNEALDKRVSAHANERGKKYFDDDLVDHSHDAELKKKFIKEMEEKIKNAKNFDDLDELFAYYTTSQGGDLMNAFFRGDLTVGRSSNKKGAWNTNLSVDIPTFLDTMNKALKLRKRLVEGVFKEDMVLYRGSSVDNLLKYIPSAKDREKVKECIDAPALGKKLEYDNLNIPYNPQGASSTSTEESIAYSHVFRKAKAGKGGGGILIKINARKGTAFGVDFKNTAFGNEDKNKEVLLKPNQKFNITKIVKESYFRYIECETIG